MSVFRRKRTTRKGKTSADKTYTVEFRDHGDIVRRLPGFTDRAASAELERQLKRLVSLRMAGAGPDAELSRFLEAASGTIRERLGEWGVITGQRAKGGKPLSALVDSWGTHLRAREFGESHCRESVSCVLRALRETRTSHWSELAADKIESWLAGLRKSGASVRTSNAYLAKLKAFCNWMVRTGAAATNPLAFLRKLNEATDRRHERHALTVEEMAKLLAAAESGPVVHGMDGWTRALLYHTAATTGLRWSELRSLTRSSFDFSSPAPSVTIKAKDAKNGQDDVLTLQKGLAEKLKAHMALFLPAAQAFPGMWKGKGAEMIRADLEAAGILARDETNGGALIVVDEYGRAYDFHSLRATFATMLNAAGVPLATAQRLMRHSDPKLTANVYTKTLIEDKASAIARLPEIRPAMAIRAEAKTGTADIPDCAKSVDRPGDRNGGDAMDKITTCSDSEKRRNALRIAMAENEKNPVPQGQTGSFEDGGQYWVRTSGPLLVRQVL